MIEQLLIELAAVANAERDQFEGDELVHLYEDDSGNSSESRINLPELATKIIMIINSLRLNDDR